MAPKPSYKPASRESQKAVMFFLDEDVRAAFKYAAAEKGISMQIAFERWVQEYAADQLKLMRQK